MPELPPDRRRVVPPVPETLAGGMRHAAFPYAELHCKTNFSFLEGAAHPDELVRRAAELGYAALAVTDRNSLAGVVRAHVAAKEVGLPLVIGAEITPRDAPAAVLLATDRAGYSRLCRLITLGRRRAEKGSCDLAFADLAEHAEGLLALVLPPADLAAADEDRLADQVRAYRAAFADRSYLFAELSLGPDDERQWSRLERLARRARAELVVGGAVCYHVPERQELHDILTAVRAGRPVSAARDLLLPNRERHLRPIEGIRARFAAAGGGVGTRAVRRAAEVAARCHFSLEELRYEYPLELCPAGTTPLAYLERLTWEGAARRYPAGVPDKVRHLIEHELSLIRELRYEAYFLTVWDLMRFARSRDILCQGRGSAANSAVCYCLEVTAVDPDRIDVLFERFVSKERDEASDIDVDFEHQRREEVLQYIYDKYGREHAGMTAEVITYRARSAVRDVGKALGLSLDRVDKLAKSLEGYRDESGLAERFLEGGLDPRSELGQRLLVHVETLIGFPRHLSQHVGGMVMTRTPLCELVPIENAAMPGRTVIEWDKNDLDSLGILKVDCLALGMLSALHRALDLVERHHGRRLTLAAVPPEDPAVYEMIGRADTIGVFQIESRAQMSMLPRLKPSCFYDLVIEVAIVRPGPIQGDMVHPYLRRRSGEEPVEFPNDAIRAVLQKTLGVPLFQEQAMRLAVVAAGFTPGEADQLRRAMGAWRRPGIIEAFRQKLIEGMRRTGLAEEYADRVFKQIRGFGEYGFPESHAASFALLVYVSAWLKHYYPAAFCAAVLNSQPMGFYAPAQLVRDARAHGVVVRPIDVNQSRWDSTLEGQGGPADVALRLGFRLISGLGERHARAIEAEREKEGPFASVEEFARRTRLGKSIVARLASADAFASLACHRRAALWDALVPADDLPLFGAGGAGAGEASAGDREPLAAPALPELSPAQEVVADYRAAGLSLRAHPFSFLRQRLDELGIVPASGLATHPDNRPIRVAGLVLLRQRPATAKGIRFVTLEDETGTINLVIRPTVWDRYHRAAARAAAYLVHGRLERRGEVIHVLTSRIEDLSALLAGVRPKSRDFR